MKQKNLLILAVVFAALLVIVFVKKSGDQPLIITDSVALKTLIPSDLAAADLGRLEMYIGEDTENKLVLERDSENPEMWHIASRFNAPVTATKIDEFLDTLVKLKGEFRQNAATDEVLQEFELSDAKAFHVTGYKKDASDAAFDLLIGESPKFEQAFARTTDSNDIYVINANLRSQAGMQGDTLDVEQAASTWLEKKIVDLDPDTIDRIDITTPTRQLVLAKQVTQPEPDAATTEEPADEAGDETAADEPIPAAEPVEKWVVESGGLDQPVKEAGINGLARTFDSLYASDIVDPAKKVEYGLEPPMFRAVISLADKDEDIVLEGGKPANSEDEGFIRVASSKNDVVYTVASYNFERTFGRPTDLFDLPSLTLERDAVQRIDIAQPEGTISLVKSEDDWAVEQPAMDLPVQQTKISSIVTALTSLKPSDYADSQENTGLDKAGRSLTVTSADGTAHTITVGAMASGIGGSYARIDDNPAALVIKETDLDKLFVGPKDVFELTLLDILPEDIKSIAVAREANSFTLLQRDGAWMLATKDLNVSADQPDVESLTQAIASLQASDILLNKTELSDAPFATLRVALNNDTGHAFIFGPEKNGAHELKVSGKQNLFLISTLDAQEVLPPTSVLVPDAPVEPAEPEAATDENAVPAEGESEGMSLEPMEGESAPGGETISLPLVVDGDDEVTTEITETPADSTDEQPATEPVEGEIAPSEEPGLPEGTETVLEETQEVVIDAPAVEGETGDVPVVIEEQPAIETEPAASDAGTATAATDEVTEETAPAPETATETIEPDTSAGAVEETAPDS